MNIKSRIKKIESVMNNGGNLCLCPDTNRYELWRADLSAKSATGEARLQSAEVPDVCPQCRKPIEKQKFILRLCDRTTRDRFPEQWNA